MLLGSRRVRLFACPLGLVVLLGGGVAAYSQEPPARPEFVPQVAHTSDVEAISFTPDGAWLASASRDQSVKLWNTETGELVRSLQSFSSAVTAVQFSPDGELLATAGALGGGPVQLWDWRTGKLVRFLPGPPGGVSALVWWPDGKRVAAGFLFGGVMVWDTATGQTLRTLSDLKEPVVSLAVARDGSALYAGGNREALNLKSGALGAWRSDTWELLIPRREYPVGVSSLCLTPDSRSLVVGELHGPSVQLLDPRTGQLQRALTATAEAGYDLEVLAVAASPDGRLVAAGYSQTPHHPLDRIALWDLGSGGELGRYHFPTDMGLLRQLVFSPDGAWLASTNGLALPVRVGAATQWQVAATEARLLFGGDNDVGMAAVLMPGGKGLAAGRECGGASLWDLTSGRIAMDIALEPQAKLRSVAVTSDGRTVIGSIYTERQEDYGGAVVAWEAATGAVRSRIHDVWQDIGPVAVSPTGGVVACYCAGGGGSFKSRRAEGEVRLWSLPGWTPSHVLKGHTNHVVNLAFSPDGQRLVTCAGALSKHFYGGEALLWDVTSGRQIARLDNQAIVGVPVAAFSPDGTLLVTGGNGPLKLWQPQSGEALGQLEAGALQTLALGFSPDGKVLACAQRQGPVALWNVAARQQVGELRRAGGWVRSVQFTPDGARLIVAAADGTLEVWHLAERRLLVTLYTVPPGPNEQAARRLWLAVTPEGYYDCAEGADHVVKWRHYGNRMVPFYQFEEVFRRPDLVRRALGGGRITEAPLMLERIPPVCEFVQPTERASIFGDTVRVLIACTDDVGIAETTIHVNGLLVPQASAKAILAEAKPIAVEAKPLPPGHKVRQLWQTEVPLPAGQETVTIRASVYDAERNRGDAVVNLRRLKVQPVQRHLYAVCVGISEYRNPRYNLKYAAADATALAQALRAQQGGAYAAVQANLLTDAAASAAGIRQALAQLRQATENDLVMVFLSGHGAQDDGQFYFATHSLFVNDIAGTCLSWSEVIAALAQVRAKRILLADACHSGTKLGDRQASNEQLAEAGRRSGIVIMASSRGEEFSFELAEHGHGSFTVGLLEAFAGQADFNRDRQVTLPELEIYVPKRVTELTGGLQHPHLVAVEDFDPQVALTVVR